MTTGIRVSCSRCGAEVDSSQRHSSGICGLCLVRDECKPLLAEYGRLWLKHLRYQAKGAPTGRIAEQMRSVAARVEKRVQARVANFEAAISLHNAMLVEAREQAAAKGSRIRVAAAGDLVLAR